jgi:hypothetical protein
LVAAFKAAVTVSRIRVFGCFGKEVSKLIEAADRSKGFC